MGKFGTLQAEHVRNASRRHAMRRSRRQVGVDGILTAREQHVVVVAGGQFRHRRPSATHAADAAIGRRSPALPNRPPDSMRCCGSMLTASRREMPKNGASNRSTAPRKPPQRDEIRPGASGSGSKYSSMSQAVRRHFRDGVPAVIQQIPVCAGCRSRPVYGSRCR